MFGFGGKRRLKAEVERLKKRLDDCWDARMKNAIERDRVEAEAAKRIAGLEAYASRLKAEVAQLDAVKATIARTLHEEGEGYRAEIGQLIAQRDEAKSQIELLKAKCDELYKQRNYAQSYLERYETPDTHFPSLR